ncbi:nucleotide exchange factor GrpE [Saccharopolyspora sp. HNM0986]|uniref:nucleotide exchange factor GrpE n=1 Tax=Saccharopolyspora galaxeae TaxID=2781241 RepID=UPI00190D1593|nr:nucleotide exchange factor GrpE [Saccharopolyspora sp. HNM0986]MBK0867998.1 nucleotide exchange factor GrpE [Saccharopolyspora sp. HNM0986]
MAHDEQDPPNALPIPAEHPRRRPTVVTDLIGPPESARTDAQASADPADQLDRLRGERDEHLASLQRLAAEFDNYRKRMLREQTANLDRAAEGLLRELLPVLDAVELGAKHNPEALGAVHKQLQQTLAAEGLHRIDPLGEPFDPAEHEAAPSDSSNVIPLHGNDVQANAVVAEVLRPGYRTHGRLIRPALVRVASGG